MVIRAGATPCPRDPRRPSLGTGPGGPGAKRNRAGVDSPKCVIPQRIEGAANIASAIERGHSGSEECGEHRGTTVPRRPDAHGAHPGAARRTVI